MSGAYLHLREFVSRKMRMSQVYQPVMLMELLRGGGTASVEQVARAILEKDPTQVEYFSEIVRNMVGRVLTGKPGIVEKSEGGYRLVGAQELSDDQVAALIALCQEKIEAFERKRGTRVWEHRRRGHRPVPGSIRFEVLKRAGFRCELCGVPADEKNLEVDHIHPKSLGGKDDLSNYQALCYTCNAQKKNTDDTDFRGLKAIYGHREEGCLFCDIQTADRGRIVEENALAFVVRDAFAVTEHHSLVVPRRHVADYFGLSQAEINAVNQMIRSQKALLDRLDLSIDGYNIGANCGESAGQTIFHCHVHLIPRRRGDVESPRGGVRHVIPGRGNYQA